MSHSPGTTWRAPWTLVLTLGAVAVLIGVVTSRPHAEDATKRLAGAMTSLDFRPVEPRLTGGFPHKPLRRAQAVSNATFLAVAADATEARPRALAFLLQGKADAAVSLLEKTIQRDDGVHDFQHVTDPGVLTDFAGALYERALQTQRPADLARGYVAVTRALEIAPTSPEALYVRGLLLEQLHLDDDAREAWRAYLGEDATSPWAAEARQHVVVLDHRSVILDRENADADRLAATWPEGARTAVEEILLGRWADAVRRGDERAARATLGRAERLGRALAARGRDRVALDTAIAIRNPVAVPTQTAAAYAAYTSARSAYLKERNEAARAAMHEAAELLEAIRSPLAPRAWIYAATVSHYLGKTDAALQILDRVATLQRGRESRYPLASGQMLWTRGLIDQARGHSDDALANYLAARQHLEHAGEAASLAGISTVISETYRYIGDDEKAWTHALFALRWLHASTPYMRRQIVLHDVALLAVHQRLYGLADLMTERVVRNARAADDPVFESLALLTRGRALMARARPREAGERFEQASARLEGVPLNGTTGRLAADLLIARGEALAETNPATAIAFVAEAEKRLHSLQNRTRLPQLHLIAARAHRTLHDASAEERELRTGLEELERQRQHLQNDRDRSTFTDTRRALFDELVSLLVARGDEQEALQIVRRARTFGHPTVVHETVLADDSVLLEFYFTADALLVWVTTSHHLRLHHLSVKKSAVEDAVARLRSCVDWGNCIGDAATLHELLIAPVRAGIAGRDEVLVAPDDLLHNVPFPALYDRATRKFMAEEHAITILLSATPPPPAGRFESIAVASVPAAIDDLPALRSTAGEAHHAAGAFARATVLSGAEATPERFLAVAARHDVAHFAGHATWNEREPERATLRFGRGGDRTQDLSAGAIAKGTLTRTKLVVLAGCDTARGRSTTAGPLSLARAFAAAGVPYVIGTRWPIEDERSARFFADFYTALARGDSAARALRHAQIAAIRSAAPGPDSWAVFQLYASSTGQKEKR